MVSTAIESIHMCDRTVLLQGGQWWRLIWSAFLHADEWHLYYNMSSFLWKGLQLEPAYGPARFLVLLVELLISCQSLYCGLFWGARAIYGPQSPAVQEMYSYTCAVGFSGVLFGLKAVLTSGTSAWQHVNVPLIGMVRLPPKVCCTQCLYCMDVLLCSHMPVLASS